ncbi:MAG: hypothetical protein FWG49_03490 [Leptospirales bacterium]|nr:hypothetical protein [Leptospirales bacterium]
MIKAGTCESIIIYYGLYKRRYTMDDTMEKAIKYISEILKETPDADKVKLVAEASAKFNLNPLQTEFLSNKIF